MRIQHKKKPNYGIVVIFVLVFSVIAGFLLDFTIAEIERAIYKKPEEYTQLVEKYSDEYGISEELIYAVIKTESDFDSAAVSSKGAVGLMQIMPTTFEWITEDLLREDLELGMLFDPETNIKYGTYYLSRLYNRFGDWDTAIAAYNGGEGNVSDWLKDSKYSDDGVKLIIDNIPTEFSETENYVKKVNKAFNKYKKLYQED